MKRILLVAMLFAVASVPFSHPISGAKNQQSSDEQAVRQLLNELYAALGRNDTAALERLYADDYTFVNEDGALITKAPRLAAIKSGEMKYESLRFDDVNVRIYGNTAVATYRAMVKVQNKGKEIGGQFKITVTLVKAKDHWQVVAAQSTRIAVS